MQKSLLLSVLFLAGCTVKPVFSPEQEKAIVRACMEQVQAPGSYSISPGRPSANPEGALPSASAIKGLGGTTSGAAAINACIQQGSAS